MTQSPPTIGANKTGIQYRTEDNDGKKALLNHHKASSAPSYAEAGTLWLDDTATPWLLKMHDGADWITIAAVNATTNAVEAYHGAAPLRVLNHASDTGAANAYAVAPTPAMTAYVAGQIVTLKPANANTASSTLAVNGLSAKNIKLLDGSDPAAGALAATGVYQLVYDGTNFVLLNPALGSAAYLTAGTAANHIVQLDGAARLPAVDGSQLTGISTGYVGGGYTDQYFTGLGYRPTASGQSFTANRLYFMPFQVFSTTTFTRIGLSCSASSGGTNARLGIYNGADGVPTTKVIDAGTVSLASMGEKEITISQSLAAGQYFLAVVLDSAAPSLRYYATLNEILDAIIGANAPSTGTHIVYLYHAHTYGALPSSASAITVQDNSANPPCIWLRKA